MRGDRLADIVNSALQQPKLGTCLNTWIGPGTVLTNANRSYVDFRQSSAQLSQMTQVSNTVGTVQVPVPSSGRGTIYIASEFWGNKNGRVGRVAHPLPAGIEQCGCPILLRNFCCEAKGGMNRIALMPRGCGEIYGGGDYH